MDHTAKIQIGKSFPVAEVAENEIGSDLVNRRDALLASEPKLRRRALAEHLGVSEAEILLSECGRSARLLRPEWPEILSRVPSLGTVMAFTRNDSVFHEKIGRYGKVCLDDRGQASVRGEEIDLRLFLDQWRLGFAVREGVLNSLQFFDRFGAAAHKVYLLDDSDTTAFDALVDAYGCYATDSTVLVERASAPGELPLDFAIDLDRFRADWDSLRSYEFGSLLKRYGLMHVQAFRLAGDKRARQLPTQAFSRALEIAAERALPIVLLIENLGALQIHAGPIINLSKRGRWLNVIDPTFNLHLLEDSVDETWVLSRSTPQGAVLSLEAVDAAGNSVATLFGMGRQGLAEDPGWAELLKSF